MKIGLITFHTPVNYGAVLQAYALSRYLNKNCGDTEIINYNTKALKNKYPVIRKPNSVKTLCFSMLQILHLSERLKKMKLFEDFRNKYLPLTKKYESFDELDKEKFDYDFFVTGSDQVFGPNRIKDERRSFYLDFVKNTKKISYAGSFGVTEIPEKRKDEIKEYLNKFDCISVREESGKKIVKNEINKDIDVVVDPVFLLSKDEWIEAEDKEMKLPQEYILYYRLLIDKKGDLQVKNLAKEMNLPVIVLSDEPYSLFPGAIMMRTAGPAQFIRLYHNATFVVTNAFHGVAFALIFEKNFIFSDENASTRERGEYLLKRFEIEEQATDKCDFNSAKIKISECVDKSENYLKSSLKVE